MEFKNIKNKILELKTLEEQIEFINKRIKLLEKQTPDDIVDYEHNVFYNNYISENVQYRPYSKCVKNLGISYNDIKLFLYFVNKINSKNYNIYDLIFTFYSFKQEYFKKNEFLDDKELEYKRASIYMDSLLYNKERIPIEQFSYEKCAGSTEIAGLCHNIFKFFGYKTTLISGIKNGKEHSYNLIYPNEYSDIAILFDPSSEIVFKKKKETIKLPFIQILSSDEINSLLEGKNLIIKTEVPNLDIRNIYKIDNEYTHNPETINYTIKSNYYNKNNNKTRVRK